MMTKRNFVVRVCVVLSFLLAFIAYAQQNDVILMGKTYRYENGKWFTYFQNRIGDEILPHRIIVRLSNKGKMTSFDFESFRISGVSVASRRIVDGFYLLKVDVNNDPFEIADLLEKTNLFDSIDFDALGQQADVPDDRPLIKPVSLNTELAVSATASNEMHLFCVRTFFLITTT